MGEDEITLFPMGWGFALFHKHDEVLVVTDGGSHNNCIHKSKQIFSHSNIFKSPHNWVWILSHFDYDHYSILVSQVCKRFWNLPSTVILPAIYSLKECKQTLKMYYTLSLVLSFMMHIPKPNLDLFMILKKVRRLGVKQGDRITEGRLTYHIIWPPSSVKAGNKCKKLLKALETKLKQYKKKCEKLIDHPACEEIFKKAKTESDILVETLSPTNTTGPDPKEINVRSLINTTNLDKYENNMVICNKKSRENLITYSSLYELYDYATMRFNDQKLMFLHKQVINLFSLAYALLLNNNKDLLLLDLYYIGDKNQREEWISSWFLESNHILFSFSNKPCIILYLSDLDNHELKNALEYYLKTIRSNPIIEIAPHHGNAYNKQLEKIQPEVIYLSRCDYHVPHKYTNNFRYHSRLKYLTSGKIVLYSHHSLSITISI